MLSLGCLATSMGSTSFWETTGASALIGAAGVLIGGLIAGVVAPFLQHRLSSKARVKEAHLRAAGEHAERVAAIYRTLDEIAYSVLGDEVGVIDPEGTAQVNEISHAGIAIGLLRELRSAHPTSKVREAARKLEDDLRGFYGNPPPQGTDGWPSYDHRDVILGHSKDAETLIELLHVAP